MSHGASAAEVIVLDGNSSSSSSSSNANNDDSVIEIDDSSSASDQQRRLAQKQRQQQQNEVICIDSSGDELQQQVIQRQPAAKRQRGSDKGRKNVIMNGGGGVNGKVAHTNNTRRGKAKVDVESSHEEDDDDSDYGAKSDSSSSSLDSGLGRRASRADSEDDFSVEWKPASSAGSRRNGYSNNTIRKRTTPRNGIRNGNPASIKSDSSTSFTSTSYLSSLGSGGGDDRNNPRNGHVMVRVRSSDGRMILTKRKPKTLLPPQPLSPSKKRARLETHYEEPQSRRCPICFTHVPEETFEKHKSTCGQDLIGEFQNNLGAYAAPSAEARGVGGLYVQPPPAATDVFAESEVTTGDFLLPSNNINNNRREKSPRTETPAAESKKKKQEPQNEKKKATSKRSARRGSSVASNDTISSIGRSAVAQSRDSAALHPHFTRGGAKRKFKNEDDDDAPWRKEVEEAIRDVRERRKIKRQELLRDALNAKNELLSKTNLMPPAEIEFPVLNGGSVNMECSRLDDPDHPLPRDDFTTIFLKKHFHTDEKTDPSETDSKGETKKSDPYDEDATLSTTMSRDRLRFSTKIEEFQNGEKIGVGYEENDTDEEISLVLDRLKDARHNRDEIHGYMALLLQENVERINDHYTKACNKLKPKVKKIDSSDPYKSAMSSFRDLFCRRCLTYDCNLHGLAEDTCHATQAELAIHREISGYWKDRTPIMCYPVTNPDNPPSSENVKCPPQVEKTTLSATEKALCQKLFHAFQGDIDKVSRTAGLAKDSIIEQASLIPFQFTKINPAQLTEVRSKANKSNTYNPSWVKKIVETESHPFFYPCYHSGPCSEATCTCIKNGFFCTKHCIWGSSSRNFFKGCNCTAKCTAKSCPCFASNRECDPDLCRRCDSCSDPPNQPASGQPCRNDNIGMRRHVHLLVGKSTVGNAGWGLFTKYPLKKGDYIHEYLGEVIPQDEAEKRGAVYDEKNQTYLFDLTSDCAVDALRKGNKTRFINHSITPNIGPRILVVNGDFRIGFFAKVDIPAQTELFFDYGKMFFSSKGSFAHRTQKSNSTGGTG